MDKKLWRKSIIIMLTFAIAAATSTPLIKSTEPAVVYAKHNHRQPVLLDQQIAILVRMEINSKWVKQQSKNQSLIYGIVKPTDTVPKGVDGYSWLATSSDGEGIYLFFKVEDQKVIIQYANHGSKLHTKIVSKSHLIRKHYRTKVQR